MIRSAILRDSVKKHLLKSIHAGDIKCGNTINLAALARSLKVSVTPIREALSQLEQSRILQAIPNRGFVVPELTLKEAKNLYSTMAELEVLALEHSSFTSRLLNKLRDEQLNLQQTHTPSARLTSRVRFHHLLLRNCSNSILVQILRDLEARVLFYEQVLITDASFYEQIDNQNEAIIRAIEEDNVPTAALILKMNWMTVLDYVQKQLVMGQNVNFEEVYPEWATQ
ncbi:MAG: GntR family transcriptional regulator [Bacteroidota bacterium]